MLQYQPRWQTIGLWDRQDTGTTAKGGGPWDVPGTPNGTVEQDTGATAKGGSPWDVLETPNGTVGQTGHWDNCQGWESLGYPDI